MGRGRRGRAARALALALWHGARAWAWAGESARWQSVLARGRRQRTPALRSAAGAGQPCLPPLARRKRVRIPRCAAPPQASPCARCVARWRPSARRRRCRWRAGRRASSSPTSSRMCSRPSRWGRPTGEAQAASCFFSRRPIHACSDPSRQLVGRRQRGGPLLQAQGLVAPGRPWPLLAAPLRQLPCIGAETA